MWCQECASVAPFCTGYGLDPGAGQRTLYPHMVTCDIRPDQQPQHVADATHLPMFADNTFDFVFNSHLIEHLPDPQAAIREWVRVVKPGGHVAMVIPNTLYTLGQNTDPTPHLHEWAPKDFLTQVCECANFRVWVEARGRLRWVAAEIVQCDVAAPRWSFHVVLRKVVTP